MEQKRIADDAFLAALAPKTEWRTQPKLKLGDAKCAQCDGKFKRNFSFKIYCSDDCSNKAKYEREKRKRNDALSA